MSLKKLQTHNFSLSGVPLRKRWKIPITVADDRVRSFHGIIGSDAYSSSYGTGAGSYGSGAGYGGSGNRFYI